MEIKNNFVGAYIRKFVIPGALVFNKPGFVDFKISGKTNIYARQMFYPEFFFNKFESDVVNQFGLEGKKVLYSIGKRFGYRFAKAGKFENINDHPGEGIKQWIFIMSKFIEGTYASLIDSKIDIGNKVTEYTLKRFTIFENLGYDYIFAQGGTAGIMSWLFQDNTIEVINKSSNKIGNYYDGVVVSAPLEYLKSEFKTAEFFSEQNLGDLDENFQSYIDLNKQTVTSKNKSFQTYLDFKFFDYQNGIINYKSNRFFLFEVSGTYLLEYDLKKKGNKKLLDLLYASALESGEKIFSEMGKTPAELFDMLSAIGWGEVLQFSSSKNELKIVINHFPWSNWYDKIDFLIMRGFLAGALTKILNKKIVFEKPVIDMSKGHLSLLFGGKFV